MSHYVSCPWCGRRFECGTGVHAPLDVYCCGEKCAHEWTVAHKGEIDAINARKAKKEAEQIRMKSEVEKADFRQLMEWLNCKNDEHVGYLGVFFHWGILTPDQWVRVLCREGGCSGEIFMLADKHCKYEDLSPKMWKQLFSLGKGALYFDAKAHLKYISNFEVETQGEILGGWDCHADNYNNLIGECTARNAALWAQILLHPSFLINGDVVHLQDLEKINWKGLEGLPPEMWIRLALFRKEFAQHLNWSHFNKEAAKKLRFSSRDIFRLISYCEDVARVYPISELDTSDLTVEELRSVSDKVREDIAKSAGFALWPKLSMAFVRLDWKRFKLPEQNVLDKFSSDEWGRVLNKRPDLQSVVPDSVLDRFDAYAWYEALAGVGGKRYRQQLRNRMHSPDRIAWTKLGVKCWAWLLRDFPDLAPWFDDKMYYDEYANKAGKPIDPEQILIIGVIPDLACDFDRWDEIQPGWWPYLLERQPQFSEKCPVSAWRKMTRKDVRAIFKAQPKLRKYRRYCKGGGCLWRIVKAVCLISVLVLGLESGVSYIKKAYDGYGRDGDKVTSAVEYYERSRDSVVAFMRQLWN